MVSQLLRIQGENAIKYQPTQFWATSMKHNYRNMNSFKRSRILDRPSDVSQLCWTCINGYANSNIISVSEELDLTCRTEWGSRFM